MRYSSLMPGLSWHLPQVRDRLSLNVGECGFFGESMAWLPWQFAQDAAPDDPIERLMPWMLVL